MPRRGGRSGRAEAVAGSAGAPAARGIPMDGLRDMGVRAVPMTTIPIHGTSRSRNIQNAFRKLPAMGVILRSMSKTIEASIVVVDDEPSIRELLVASLHFSGFEVNAAGSGSEAIKVIESTHPDLIVMDWLLYTSDAADE